MFPAYSVKAQAPRVHGSSVMPEFYSQQTSKLNNQSLLAQCGSVQSGFAQSAPVRLIVTPVEDKTVISGLRSYASDRYWLLIMVGDVDGDFSQTVRLWIRLRVQFRAGLGSVVRIRGYD